jgi:hypothetical protein
VATARYDATGVTFVESTPSAAGARVLKKARAYLALGVAESPLGSNSGTYISTWQQNYDVGSVFWCGCFAGSMYLEADVDDDGIGHPAVRKMWATAYRKKLISRVPYPGCFVAHCNLLAGGTIDSSKPFGGGRHVDLFERWHNKRAGLAVVIGGNVQDKVTRYIVDVNKPTSSDPTRKSVFLVPNALRNVVDTREYRV